MKNAEILSKIQRINYIQYESSNASKIYEDYLELIKNFYDQLNNDIM